MIEPNKRTTRIAEMIQRKLAFIIQKEINDPRIPSLLTISGVNVASDLGHASIYFTTLNTTADKNQLSQQLNMAAHYLRAALARTIHLRKIPQLHFVYDESIEYSQRLCKLIDNVNPVDKHSDGDSF